MLNVPASLAESGRGQAHLPRNFDPATAIDSSKEIMTWVRSHLPDRTQPDLDESTRPSTAEIGQLPGKLTVREE